MSCFRTSSSITPSSLLPHVKFSSHLFQATVSSHLFHQHLIHLDTLSSPIRPPSCPSSSGSTICKSTTEQLVGARNATSPALPSVTKNSWGRPCHQSHTVLWNLSVYLFRVGRENRSVLGLRTKPFTSCTHQQIPICVEVVADCFSLVGYANGHRAPVCLRGMLAMW